jgi:outer membrane receptor protein involved in Fe transport
MLEYQINDFWKLSFETRFVDEDFYVDRANQSACTRLGFAVRFPNGFIFQNPFRLYDENSVPGLDNLCPIVGTPNTHFNIQGDESSSFSTPKATLEWTPNDTTLVYFSIGAGQKPGGISVVSAGGSAIEIEDLRFLPEKMTAYEIGLKKDFRFDSGSTLLLNGALFFQDYTDKQVSTQVLVDDVLQPRVLNASSAEVLGLELDATFAPASIDGLTLTASYTYLDATYNRFFSDTTSLLRAGLVGHCPIVYKGGEGPNPDDLSDPANGEATCRLDLSGNRLERSPEHSFVAMMNLQRPYGDQGREWFVQANAQYRGDRFTEEDNFQQFDSYWNLDLRFGVEAENWDALLYIDNALDDDTVKTGGPGPDFGEQITELGFTAGLGVTHWFATLPTPRIIGVRANYRF